MRFIHLELSKPVPDHASRTTAGLPAVWRPSHQPQLQHARVRQTLIRPDVAPDVALTATMPIPAVLPWRENPLPSAAEFAPVPKETPLLPRLMPALPKMEAVPAADVISIPDMPLRAQNLVVLPPANQIASDDSAGAARAADSQHMSGLAATVPQLAAASQTAFGTQGAAGEPGESARLTRITQPKDGNFGIVVSGSSASELFPDSAGVLSGNLVYTVYIRVGLRKSWILQYCLAKDTEPGSAPIGAPWPFLMLRPSSWSATDLDYTIVRGVINSSGQFEQLGLIYPNELVEQEKLLAALRQWAFRPASRAGRPVAVQALLIIPREAE